MSILKLRKEGDEMGVSISEFANAFCTIYVAIANTQTQTAYLTFKYTMDVLSHYFKISSGSNDDGDEA